MVEIQLNSLYSHGSTHNSFMADEDIQPTEATPLVRFPESNQPTWGPRSRFAFGVLMSMLWLGTIIGSYLLYLQVEAENPLPPRPRASLILLEREEWCNVPACKPTTTANDGPSRHIVVVHTDTAKCSHVFLCIGLLNEIQNVGNLLPYNFLVSSNGLAFEALGWSSPSPIFPELSAIVVAFIGNFTKETPTFPQLEEVFTIIDYSISRGHLNSDYTIIGKITEPGHVPTYLFDALQNRTQWNRVLSDDYKTITAK